MTEPTDARVVSFDLMSDDPDYYFVLTTALGDFAAQARAEAREGTNPESNTRWAEVAEDALWRIERALARGHASSEEKPPGRAACEAFWACMGTGPDGQPPSAAWDWARSQGAQDAWAAASRAAVEAAAK